MKAKRLMAGALALTLLCCGCSNNTDGKSANTADAYDRLAAEMTVWDGSINLSTAVSGELFTEYAGQPGAVRFSGQYMQQEGALGKEVFATQDFNYGDGYYYQIDLLSDGEVHAISTKSGPEDPESEEDNLIYGEYITLEEFEANAGFGIPSLSFTADQVTATSETTVENGDTVITFTLDPEKSDSTVIALMEALDYIDTETVPVDADVSSISCSATYQNDELLNLSYKFSADLTAEGEVLEVDYLFNHLLMESGELVSFGMPSVDTLVTQ